MRLGKIENLVTNLYDKTEYVIHIRNFGKAVHRVIRFNQKDWVKPYIDMNTELRQKAKTSFKKGFFKLMNNTVFGKTMENVRKYRDIKLVTTEMCRNCLVSEPNYHTKKLFTENLLAIEMKKTHIIMNKHVYVRLSTLDLSKTIMYEFCCEI